MKYLSSTNHFESIFSSAKYFQSLRDGFVCAGDSSEAGIIFQYISWENCRASPTIWYWVSPLLSSAQIVDNFIQGQIVDFRGFNKVSTVLGGRGSYWVVRHSVHFYRVVRHSVLCYRVVRHSVHFYRVIRYSVNSYWVLGYRVYTVTGYCLYSNRKVTYSAHTVHSYRVIRHSVQSYSVAKCMMIILCTKLQAGYIIRTKLKGW